MIVLMLLTGIVFLTIRNEQLLHCNYVWMKRWIPHLLPYHAEATYQRDMRLLSWVFLVAMVVVMLAVH